MFKTRLRSGIIIIIIALITIIFGGPILFGTLLIISLIGMSELYKILGVEKQLLGIVGYSACIVYYAFLFLEKPEMLTIIIIGFLVLLMMIYVFSFPKYEAEQVMLVFFGFFYVAVMLSFVYRMRILPQGAYMVWLVFFCSWGCDTCAYCVGMLIGKHKMAPKLSPKKSIEGGIGGILGAAILGAVYALSINKMGIGASADVLGYAIICGVGGMISQIGDLAASAIKRNHEIKDYGKLIPGHGGVLDRFDSVIFTAPIIYYLSVLL
ncbi:MAG: phosphatidate cytidylyltransferase [Lachnospiraceae bacterium]